MRCGTTIASTSFKFIDTCVVLLLPHSVIQKPLAVQAKVSALVQIHHLNKYRLFAEANTRYLLPAFRIHKPTITHETFNRALTTLPPHSAQSNEKRLSRYSMPVLS